VCGAVRGADLTEVNSAALERTITRSMYDHDLVPGTAFKHIGVERRPVFAPGGGAIEGLHNVWIVLANEVEMNSYSTDAIKEVILAFRHASNDRAAVCVVFTGAGNRAFCSGGNTREYATRYAGNPGEYRQYMRLFNDMVSAILACDKPVICRVNGLRVGGGQEIGMACDFSIAQDLARFGQVGPKHGSAPDGGATDFLHLFVGIEQAMLSCTTAAGLWSAHKAQRLGLLTEIVPALRVDGELVANPLVETTRWLDERGRIVHGEPLTGDALAAGKRTLQRGTIDLTELDRAVDRLTTRLMMTFPECTLKTIESLRKKKLEHWDKNREQSRAWLALNMMTEAGVGFRAFEQGGGREVDFITLRRRLAEGASWSDPALARAIMPRST
jgi:6-oxo-cyclohex-1-ene-carbonyl-CoA hydrolase